MKNANNQTFTDNDGKYSIEVPEDKTILEFSKREFRAQEVEITGNVMNIVLTALSDVKDIFELSLEELMQVEITTASKKTEKLPDIPASVVVITRGDIEKYGYQTLDEIFENVLGFYKYDDYRNLNYGVRGFFTNMFIRNIIVMVNGIDQKFFYNGTVQLNGINLPIISIDRIEIVRGPMSVIYGNDAFFGAINIITNDIKENRLNSVANISYGSENTLNVGLKMGGKINHLTFSVLAGYKETEGRDIPFNKLCDSVQTYSKKWRKDGTTKDFFKSKIVYANISGEYKDFYSNMSVANSNRNIIGIMAPILEAEPTNFDVLILNNNIGWKKTVNEKLNFNIHIDNFFGRANTQTKNLIAGLKYGNSTVVSNRFLIEATIFYHPLKNLKLMAGTNYCNQYFVEDVTDLPIGITSNFDTKALDPIISKSFFAQTEFRFFEKFLIVVGGRIEKQNAYDMKNVWYENFVTAKDSTYSYTKDEMTFVPRLALVYNISPRSVVKLMYGKGLSLPSFWENCFFLGKTHPELENQYITTQEISFSALLGSSINFNASIFYNQIEKLITRTSYWNDSERRFIMMSGNSGKLETLGGEIELLIKPFNALFFDLAVSYQKTKDKTNHIEAGYSPNFLGYAKMSYQITSKMTFSMLGNYVSAMESAFDPTPKDVTDPNSLPKGRISKPGKEHFDLSANIRYDNFLSKQIYFNLHGKNLLQQEIWYAPTLDNVSFLPKGTLHNSILLMFSMGIKF